MDGNSWNDSHLRTTWDIWRLSVHKIIGNGSKGALGRRFQKDFGRPPCITTSSTKYPHIYRNFFILLALLSPRPRVVRGASPAHLSLSQLLLLVYPGTLPPAMTGVFQQIATTSRSSAPPRGQGSMISNSCHRPRHRAALEIVPFVSGPCESVSVIFLILFDNSWCRLSLEPISGNVVSQLPPFLASLSAPPF